jgi:hypothetical protein
VSDRYSTITREVPVDHPRNTVYAAASGATGDLNSQHRVSLHPAGFRVRERGALEGTVVHAYRCPVHGIVDVRVPTSNPPEALNCAERLTAIESVALYSRVDQEGAVCGQRATWAGSSCGIGHAAGEVTC